MIKGNKAIGHFEKGNKAMRQYGNKKNN